MHFLPCKLLHQSLCPSHRRIKMFCLLTKVKSFTQDWQQGLLGSGQNENPREISLSLSSGPLPQSRMDWRHLCDCNLYNGTHPAPGLAVGESPSQHCPLRNLSCCQPGSELATTLPCPMRLWGRPPLGQESDGRQGFPLPTQPQPCLVGWAGGCQEALRIPAGS